jgi:signal transduction histidine kinase
MSQTQGTQYRLEESVWAGSNSITAPAETSVDVLLRMQRDIAVALNSAMYLPEALETVLDTILQIEGVDSGAIYLEDPTTKGFALVAYRNLSPAFVEAVRSVTPETPAVQLTIDGQPLYLRVSDIPGIPKAAAQEGLLSAGCIPILKDKQLIGSLGVCSHTREEIPQSTRHAVEAVAAQIGGAIVRIRTTTALRESEERFRELAGHLETRVQERTTDLTNLTVRLQAELANRQQAEQTLQSYVDQVRKLTLGMEKRLEEERAWISRELHDELGQQLTALNLNLSWLQAHVGDQAPAVAGRLSEAVELVARAVSTVRNLSRRIRPAILSHRGIVEAISAHVDEFRQRSGIRCRFTCVPEHLRLDDPLATTVFRIVQEALTNVARHSHATSCDVQIRCQAGEAVILVMDDGTGAPPERLTGTCSLGILGMQERAVAVGGTLQVTARPEGGICVHAKLPCPASATAQTSGPPPRPAHKKHSAA